MSSTRSAALGNLCATLLVAGGQIALTPFYIMAWGPETFGAWLIVIGITAVAGLLDLGITQSATNEMIFAFHRGATREAFAWFRFAFRAFVISATCASGLVGVFVLPLTNAVESVFKAETSAALLVVAMHAEVLLILGFNLFSASLRAAGANASASWMSALAIFLELLFAAVSVFSGHGPVGALLAMCVGRAVALLMVLGLLRSALYIPSVEEKEIPRIPLSRILWPSLANLILPLSMFVLLQGALTVLGGTLGAMAVALFGTARTLTRLPFQLGYVYTRAEFLGLSRGTPAQVRAIVSRMNWILLTFTGPALLIVGALGPQIQRYWTVGALIAPLSVFASLAAGAAAHAYWSNMLAVLSAKNAHASFTVALAVLVTLMVVGLGYCEDIEEASLLIAGFEVLLAVIAAVVYNKIIRSRLDKEEQIGVQSA